MQNLVNNFNIKDYLDLIKINKGDKILLSSDILKILIKFREKNNVLDPNTIIDFLIEKIGEDGTLLVPTYNWDFCKGPCQNHPSFNRSKNQG